MTVDDGLTSYKTAFSGNDGDGGGGLCASVGTGFKTSTGESTKTWDYEEILGVGQTENWQHYALLWDEDGIEGVENGMRKVALFVDGELDSARWFDVPGAAFVPLAGGGAASSTTGSARRERRRSMRSKSGTSPKLPCWEVLLCLL